MTSTQSMALTAALALFTSAGVSAHGGTGTVVQLSAQAADHTTADRAVTQQVADVLSSDSWLSGTRIVVTTRDGVVSLWGAVDTAPMIYRAVELTREVPGVKSINTRDLDTVE